MKSTDGVIKVLARPFQETISGEHSSHFRCQPSKKVFWTQLIWQRESVILEKVI